MSQSIRMSQFVTTYGPGAILESADGPRIIPSGDIGLFGNGNLNLRPERFEISDQRMSAGLLNGSRIFRLPSNAELSLPDAYYIYRTKAFPIWSLCVARHRGDLSVLYRGSSCPVCGAAAGRFKEAIRFIVACPSGHMDEVNWRLLVHGGDIACQHDSWFAWKGGGGSLNRVTVKCPGCGKERNLGEAYGTNWHCSGRSPEREATDSPGLRPGCERKAKIIQRQASNLRIPELSTLFTIPPRTTPLHNLLQIQEIRTAFAVAGAPDSKAALEALLKRLVDGAILGPQIARSILAYSWQEIGTALADVQAPISSNYGDLLHDEFAALVDASDHGYPRSGTEGYAFEVNPALVFRYAMSARMVFKVAAVSRLRTVTVQRGFRREVDSRQRSLVVSSGFQDSAQPLRAWYPGVEFLGEGIFVTFDGPDALAGAQDGAAFRAWSQVAPSAYPPEVFRTQQKDELSPVFIWWHTLSHLLMRAVSVEAGYSASSIRERVYLGRTGDRPSAGILLYATQSGTEGTLGGLTALVSTFNDYLSTALSFAGSCSSDPLCGDSVVQAGRTQGAACYACCLVSETSCEHRNMWLDRNIVREAGP